MEKYKITIFEEAYIISVKIQTIGNASIDIKRGLVLYHIYDRHQSITYL